LYSLSLNEYADPSLRFQFIEQAYPLFFGEDKKYIDYYLSCFRSDGSFPSYSDFLNLFGLTDDYLAFSQINVDRQGFLKSCWDDLLRQVRTMEIQDIQGKILQETDIEEKNKLILRLQSKIAKSEKKIDLIESADIDITSEKQITDGIIFPIKDLNEIGQLLPGTGASLISIPGGGKTSFAVNMVYQNSFKRDKNSMYIFAEDVIENYIYRIKSRASFDLGMNIPVKSLQYSIRDEESILKIKELNTKYQENRKGKIYFVNFADLLTDPMGFANMVSDLVIRYDIDFVVFDYIQRVELWKSREYSKNEYLNLIVSAFFQVLLGAFNKKPIAGLLLSQTTKDGIERANKHKGKYHLEDAKEVGNLEQDSFFILTTWMDDESKEAGTFNYQNLKCRYGTSFNIPRTAPCDLLYCSMGDIETDLDKVYNNESMQSVFNDSMEEL
jgi:hypothetical protein